MRLHHDEAVLLLREASHVTVRLPVVKSHRSQVVERGVQIVGHMGWGGGGEGREKR